jgi:enoyl-CoA hydratase
MSDDYTVIRLDRNGPIAEVVLDNPKKLNAMSPAFFDEFGRIFREIDEDESIHVAIVWAEGRLFCAGLDLFASGIGSKAATEESEAIRKMRMYRHVLKLQDDISAPERCRKPVIAAVHNHAIGGGVDISTACDIRLCTEDATFAIHETKIGLVADVGTLQRITPIVGKGMAREMAYTGKRIPSDQALATGLVNHVYPDKETMLEAARALAQEIAANSTLAVQGTKQVLQYAEEHTIAEGLDHIAHWNTSFMASNDLKEAIDAFKEKREPKFTGT